MKEQIRLDSNTLRWAEQQTWAYGFFNPKGRELRSDVCNTLQGIFHHYVNYSAIE